MRADGFMYVFRTLSQYIIKLFRILDRMYSSLLAAYSQLIILSKVNMYVLK